MLQLLKLPDGTVKVLVEGGQRARIAALHRATRRSSRPTPSSIDEQAGRRRRRLEALARTVVAQFEQYIKLNKKIPPEVLVSINQIDDPSKLADTVASHLALKIAEKQELLETDGGRASGWSGSTPSWKARSASCRWRSASATASSGRWRRPSASTT